MSSGYKSWILLTGFILFYVAYLLLGALVFSTIERPVENKLKSDIQVLKEEFLNQSCVNATSLENFLEKVLQANKYGISILPNSSASSNWDMASSLFFANTLVTTVGYGHTTPLSDTGKAFSIFYALLGVPFTMLVLTACVQRLMHPVTYGPISMCRQRLGLDPLAATAVHFAILLLLVVLGFFVVPAVVFSHIEDTWSFLDAIYFCFITLCTIGLGDYVPGEKPGQKFRSLYKISVMVYLFLGLMMMYLVLRAFHRMADLHGLTSFFQLPHCDEDTEEDKEPIIEAGPEDQHEAEASAKPLDPASQTSYNTINR
ncbi:potassium channel subfamily K member 6-like [Salvelinus namaycush]|uniref:Potassium channel subfamily K member n=1 Tax=Salvelinus namaycush TaxID=8040 RepID=A0A8U0TJ27_SALNM|nr:potassium channel subfamily K member 6-like [Salvelinus namaycush]